MLMTRISSDWRERTPYCRMPHAKIWLRDEGKCRYCGFDLLRSYEFAYYFYQYDHLLPKEADKYPELMREEWNLVLACRACNELKHSFDPNRDPVPGENKPAPIYTPEHKVLSEAERAELISRARAYLEKQRKLKLRRFEKDKELLLAAMRSSGASTAANAFIWRVNSRDGRTVVTGNEAIEVANADEPISRSDRMAEGYRTGEESL
jgi:HNH endonuclease